MTICRDVVVKRKAYQVANESVEEPQRQTQTTSAMASTTGTTTNDVAICYDAQFCSQLYRTRKHKPWNDGFLVFVAERGVIVLYDANHKRLENLLLPAGSTIRPGMELDFDYWLCVADMPSNEDITSFPGLRAALSLRATRPRASTSTNGGGRVTTTSTTTSVSSSSLSSTINESITAPTRKLLPRMRPVLKRTALQPLLKQPPRNVTPTPSTNTTTRSSSLTDSLIHNAILGSLTTGKANTGSLFDASTRNNTSQKQQTHNNEQQPQQQRRQNPHYVATGDAFQPMFTVDEPGKEINNIEGNNMIKQQPTFVKPLEENWFEHNTSTRSNSDDVALHVNAIEQENIKTRDVAMKRGFLGGMKDKISQQQQQVQQQQKQQMQQKQNDFKGSLPAMKLGGGGGNGSIFAAFAASGDDDEEDEEVDDDDNENNERDKIDFVQHADDVNSFFAT